MTKKLLLSLGLAAGLSSAQGQIFSETFDDATGFTIGNSVVGQDSFFSDGSGDYLGLTGGTDDFGGDATPSVLKAYTGFTGSYLTGMDLDGEGADSTFTFTWSGLNIVNYSNLEFSGDFAEFFDSPGDIDPTDQLFVEAQIDGGGFNTILEFTPGSFSSSVNGVFEFGAFTLGDAAQTFTAAIAGTGSLLDLRLTANLNSGDEDFAVDNFAVSGTVIPEPSATFALLGLFGLALRRRRA